MATTQIDNTRLVDFSFLDTEEFRSRYAADENQTKVCFYVGGIQCEKCIRKLEGLVGTVRGLRQLRVELGKKLVHVELDPKQLSFARIAEIISENGFDPIPLSGEQEGIKAERLENRKELIRLAVAGACAGNIMTFAFAIYFGGQAELFAWLSFLLYLPVVSFVAWPFYIGAWRALQSRRISIDLPMAVASFSGFLFSFLNLISGRTENIYFDSLSGFLFLILLARWTQRKLQKHFLNPIEMIEGLKLNRARALNATDNWQWIPTEHLTVNDRFKLFSGECVPGDAELESTRAQFSLAWLTGEALPKTFLRGSRVPAGSRILSAEATLKLRVPLESTEFGKILNQVQKFSLSKNTSIQSSDRLAQWLLTVVFLAAGLFLAFYWHISPEEAIRRSLALIVLACPCAMAFGTPLALAVSLRKARQAGLVIRNANVFESALKVKTIFFDKTGTLTETDITLVEGHSVTAYQKSVILGLENHSLHPIAFGFRKAFAGTSPADFREVKETPGFGVCGVFNGKLYEIGRMRTPGGGISCELFEDGLSINKFHFKTALKPDCETTLKGLRDLGYRLVLLTGDNPNSAEELGRRLGFAQEDVAASLSPEAKAHKIEDTLGCMMVGDGINDSLALMKADVGVATSGGVASALKSAGVYLTSSSLSGVLTLIRISQEASQLIRRNLTISILYNTVGGILALAGYINPFVAAILMPISSGFILLTTYRRSRR